MAVCAALRMYVEAASQNQDSRAIAGVQEYR